MGRLGIIAGQGRLPRQIAKAHPGALVLAVQDTLPGRDLPNEVATVTYERFGDIFDRLTAGGVTQVVFAGGLARPAVNPANFDAKTLQLAPRILAALPKGDDALLRAVIAVFEDEGFDVCGAHDLLPELTANAGHLAGPDPDRADLEDISRARSILAALGPLDVGQGAVVAGGQVLGIETLQGTDAMLSFVAQTPERLRHGSRGVLVKAPKAGQDLRVDMPAIGPDTIAAARAAGLAGIEIEAGGVLLIDRETVVADAEGAGLFLRAGPL